MKSDERPTFPTTYPKTGGAYLLECNVAAPLTLRVGRLGSLNVVPGRYLYVGSAYGPGGIAARITRHQKQSGKRTHWHIDYLIEATGVAQAWAVPGGDECRIVSVLLNRETIFIPFPGFGSSDCKTCRAHLLNADKELCISTLLDSAGIAIHTKQNQ
jgi:Uri superfamily endonuclease